MRAARLTWIGILAALGLGLGAGIWSTLIEPGWVRLTEERLETERWPQGRPPFKVAVLGCLHVGAPHIDLEKLEGVVERINALRPDLIVLLGDFVIHGVLFGRFVEPEAMARRLARLRARHGVFAVLGNHDWWFDGPRVRRALEAAAVVVLENQARPLELPDGRLWIAGIADDTTRTPDVESALAVVPKAEPVIVLAHDPAVLPDVPLRAVATFAAHTHGGQVYLPLVGAPITPGRAPRRLAYGLIREAGKDLYVTAGLGTSIIPVRFNMPPEIAAVTIAAPAAD